MTRRREPEGTNDWGASETHDSGVPPPQPMPEEPGRVVQEVRYNLAGWSYDERRGLTDTLDEEGVPYDWEGFDLIIDAEDEEYVNDLVGIGSTEDDDSGGVADPADLRPMALDHLGGFLRALGEGIGYGL